VGYLLNVSVMLLEHYWWNELW